MSTLPSIEAILLEIHQSLGCPARHQTGKKQAFASGKSSIAAHKEMGQQLLIEILEALDLGPAAALDAIDHLQSLGDAYKAVELKTWTFDADDRQILWTLLGRFFIPGLARDAAFWNLDGALDRGMPGGRFWYLPEFRRHGDTSSLYLPVAQVVDWLLDLLGVPVEAFSAARSEATGGEHNELRRSLYNWRRGTTIRPGTFEKYFADDVELDFRGAFVPEAGARPAEQFAEAMAFVERKALTAECLRLEIPMTSAGRLEAILEGGADEDERMRFVGHLAVRYAPPSPKTIRQRLRFARMVQDGYTRLLKFLCPGVDRLCADPQRNKSLQLFAIYKQIYNLTMAAREHCAGQGEAAEDAWFEEHLPPWDRHALYVSILPSRRQTGNEEFAMLLTRHFSGLQPGAALEDHVGSDEATALPIIQRNLRRDVRLAEDLTAEVALVERLQSGSPRPALEDECRFGVLCQVAQSREIGPLARQAAIQRLREVAATPGEAMQGLLLEVHRLLDAEHEPRPLDARARVESLLDEAEAGEGFLLWKAAVLQYRARHLLACNDLDSAATAFSHALEASFERNYGPLRGEVARDCLAVAVANQRLTPEHHETYYKHMLAGGMMEGAAVPSIEESARWASEYFWNTLYVPYPGVERLRPMVLEMAGEAVASMMASDREGLQQWARRHRDRYKKPLPLVTGDSVLMHCVKFRANAEYLLSRQSSVAAMEAWRSTPKPGVLLVRWRDGLVLLCEMMPVLLNVADFKRQTPLMLVAEAGEAMLVAAMLSAGADSDLQDWQGMTALHSAIKSQDNTCVDALLDHPCRTDLITIDGRSPLHTAAWSANVHATMRLLGQAPELAWERDAHGNTPLELAELLIEHSDALRELADAVRRNGGAAPTEHNLRQVVALLEQTPAKRDSSSN